MRTRAGSRCEITFSQPDHAPSTSSCEEEAGKEESKLGCRDTCCVIPRNKNNEKADSTTGSLRLDGYCTNEEEPIRYQRSTCDNELKNDSCG